MSSPAAPTIAAGSGGGGDGGNPTTTLTAGEIAGVVVGAVSSLAALGTFVFGVERWNRNRRRRMMGGGLTEGGGSGGGLEGKVGRSSRGFEMLERGRG